MSSLTDRYNCSIIPFRLGMKEEKDEGGCGGLPNSIVDYSFRYLYKYWERAGILVYKENELKEFSNKLPTNAGKLLEKGRKKKTAINMDNFSGSIEKILKNGSCAILPPGINGIGEGYPLEKLLESPLADVATNIFGWNFSKDQPISSISSLFEIPFYLFIIGRFSEMTFFDRFIGSQLIRNGIDGDGFRYLLSSLIDSLDHDVNITMNNNKRSLNIFTCYNTSVVEDATKQSKGIRKKSRHCKIDEVEEILKNLEINVKRESPLFRGIEFKLYLANDYKVRDFAHHRFLKIDEFAWIIDPGFQTFGAEGKIKNETYILRYEKNNAREVISNFTRKAELSPNFSNIKAVGIKN